VWGGGWKIGQGMAGVDCQNCSIRPQRNGRNNNEMGQSSSNALFSVRCHKMLLYTRVYTEYSVGCVGRGISSHIKPEPLYQISWTIKKQSELRLHCF